MQTYLAPAYVVVRGHLRTCPVQRSVDGEQPHFIPSWSETIPLCTIPMFERKDKVKSIEESISMDDDFFLSF